MSNLKRPAKCAVSGIYKILNHTNGSFYIGSSVNMLHRCQDHSKNLNKNTHHSIYLQRAINKYGIENFEFIPIMYCPRDKETLEYWEQYFMDSLKPEYNMSPTAGSSKGVKRTPEQCATISKINKGRKFSEQSRKNLSEGTRKSYASGNRKSVKGTVWTKEQKEKRKQQSKEKWDLMSPEKKANSLKALTYVPPKQTHCKRGHELTPENCRKSALEKGKKSCRICSALTRRSRRKAMAESEGRVYNPAGIPSKVYPDGYLSEYLTNSPPPEALKVKTRVIPIEHIQLMVTKRLQIKAFLKSQGFKTKRQFHDHIIALI